MMARGADLKEHPTPITLKEREFRSNESASVEEIGRAKLLRQLRTIPGVSPTMYRVQFTACVNFAKLAAARKVTSGRVSRTS